MNKLQTRIASHPADWTPLAQQRAFRRILDAFSYPGRIAELETQATHVLPLVLATLVDPATTLADPCELIDAADRQRLGAKTASATAARFVVMPGSQVPDFEPALGTLDSPENGATVVLVVDEIKHGSGLLLGGPGIQGSNPLQVTGVDSQWWELRKQWNSAFPLGVDVVLLGDCSLVALPRTIRIDVEGGR
ncbi:phosphonate C-P lyase system protein PhnH [Burkholderia sp. Bp8963]|uniref:phosphonate C-P lyase system protein PhnH n=1 Tax=Burkholderia sp. Bp8963 TaxID=2184547 RepID=UPI000F59B385|nr:phosphonate C-P lyase system protein PhnH [Burkholderia sp. Bp8963]RQS71138.1 phosphonate C-P lyase system protein PhnH [Burkholderia sp. Bp8963]